MNSLYYYFFRFSQNAHLNKIPVIWKISEKIKEKVLKNRYFKAPYLNHQIWVCPTHSMGKTIFLGKIYEKNEIDIIQEFIKTGFNFVDVGANIGLHTLAAAFVRPNADQLIYSFEPEESIFDILMKNTQSNNIINIYCEKLGIGSQNTELPLYISSNNNKGRNSFLNRECTSIRELVKVVTLDTYFEDKLENVPVLIKIDTEGFEYDVIKGGKKIFTRINDIAVICEISPIITEEDNSQSIFHALKECGFKSAYIIIDDETFYPNGKLKDEQYNVLFTKEGEINEKLMKSQFLRSIDF
jgi:FkbM family methyltransferase